jgi:ligand-binding sensor domain-containing protein
MMRALRKAVSGLFILTGLILVWPFPECGAEEPTLARLAFWVPPERMAEFKGAYEQKVLPVLQRHGLVPSAERGRATPDSLFSRLFELSAPTEVVEKREALDADSTWSAVLHGLGETFGSSTPDGRIDSEFSIYSTPAGPGRTEPAGPFQPLSVGRGRGHWRTFGVKDGLTNNVVLSMLQDRDGVLWLGTQGGAARYDGQNWSMLTTADGLQHNEVLSLAQDRDGYLWFGTQDGVSRYDGREWRTFTVEDGLAANRVASILQDRDGILWFGTLNGVSRYDGREWRTFTVEDGLAANDVASMLQDRDGTLWFGGRGGVSRYNPRKWSTFMTEGDLAPGAVHTMCQDRDGAIWFGTKGSGVAKLEGREWTTFTTADGLVSNYVLSITEDRGGVLWFGTGDTHASVPEGGVSRYDGVKWETYTAREGLAADLVSSVLPDREGHLWFGTLGGVSRYGGESFRTFADADRLPGRLTRTGLQDREGYLWFSVDDVVLRYDGLKWTVLTSREGQPFKGGPAFQDREGAIWFGTRDRGVVRYDGSTFTSFTTADGLAENDAPFVCQGQRGIIWMGTASSGATRFDGKAFTTFTRADGLLSNSVRSLLEDRDGHIWIGAIPGVSRYDGSTFSSLDLGSSVYSILQDRKGDLWFGTRVNGVSRYDPRFESGPGTSMGSGGKRFTTFTIGDGLAANFVTDIFEDRRGHLWFMTVGGGATRFDGRTWTTLTEEDGLADNSVLNGLQDRDGDIWIGTLDGVTRYRPSTPCAPPVFIDAVVADRRYESISDLSLPSSAGLIAFEFHGLSLKTRPNGMVYRYRLEGHENDWRSTHARRLEYRDLPVGSYTFEVLAVDRDLVYSEEPARVALEVYYQPMSSSVRISDLKVQDVFASYHKTYAEQPVGSAQVVNDDPNPVEATVSFYIPDLMGRPTEETVSLEPQSAHQIPLHAILNQDILDLVGDVQVQAEVALSCDVGDQIISVKEPRSITIHGRGALTWDTLGRAAAFVTPEDEDVATFARSLYVARRHQIKGRMADGNTPAAMLMFEALSTHGIKYARDASSPYSQTRTDQSAIDHIQYPAELLRSGLGDCDDCTVLYCSLLENLDIPTAFIDAPSHILMMFDSGVTDRRKFGFSLPEDRYIRRDGRFWIPVEVTKLGEGTFMDAWELGAQTCQRLALEGGLKATEVREAWQEFPYSLPKVEGDLELPDAEQVETRLVADLAALRKMREDHVQRRYVQPLMDEPGNHELRMELAQTRVESEDYNGAITALMPLLDTPLRAEGLYLIGYAYAGRKDYRSAVRYVEEALGVDPENVGYAESLRVLRRAESREN